MREYIELEVIESLKQEIRDVKLENANLYHKIEFLVSHLHRGDLRKKELYDMSTDDYVDQIIADMAL